MVSSVLKSGHEKLSIEHRKLGLRPIKYLRENPCASPMLLFQIMPIICAIFSAYGNESTADELAIYAFYLLVVRAVLQFLIFPEAGGSDNVSSHPY